ncbi:hypothetical protein [Ralstonia syzygii]|uniref:Lipoprotein n=1 Tax=Ralstonia syzygii R24 TaxID=907261 RepID=G3A2Y3_9RALS|nr:hypothetical protein [Ralstonia syzygii]CCA85804.1 hypothetical protein RALSY_20417 [Ralstonia syzygii R24]
MSGRMAFVLAVAVYCLSGCAPKPLSPDIPAYDTSAQQRDENERNWQRQLRDVPALTPPPPIRPVQ